MLWFVGKVVTTRNRIGTKNKDQCLTSTIDSPRLVSHWCHFRPNELGLSGLRTGKRADDSRCVDGLITDVITDRRNYNRFVETKLTLYKPKANSSRVQSICDQLRDHSITRKLSLIAIQGLSLVSNRYVHQFKAFKASLRLFITNPWT